MGIKVKDRFILKAEESASFTHDKARYRMGAVIVGKGKELISQAHNYYILNGEDLTVHAEVAAIIRADKRKLKGSTIYVAGFRHRRDGSKKPLKSKPCSKCMSFIRKFEIGKIVYKDRSGNIVTEQV